MLFSTVHLKELKIGRFIVKHEFRDQILKQFIDRLKYVLVKLSFS